MEQLVIEGVALTPLRQIHVPGGDVWHGLKRSEEGFVDFGEVYFSRIERGVVKGWKRHRRMTLNIVVLQGAIRFVIFDDREGSASRGEFVEVVLSPEGNYQRLTVAPGLWMAFQGVAEGMSMLMDVIPETHEDGEVDKRAINEINFRFE